MQQVGISLNQVRENANLTEVSFIKKNYEFKKIRERQNDPLFKMLIGNAFAEISVFAGLKSAITHENKHDILKMILSLYNDLTLEEIYKAFELERYGAYDEKTEHFQLFNADYISKVLKKYKVWRQNLKIHHNISGPTLSIEQSSNVSSEEQKKIMDSAIIRLYNEFLDNGEISIPCSFVFDELWEREVITLRNYDLPMYRKIAEREVKSEVKSKKATDKSEYNSVKETLSQIESNKLNEKVLAHAKRLVLFDFFKKIKTDNLNINQITKSE